MCQVLNTSIFLIFFFNFPEESQTKTLLIGVPYLTTRRTVAACCAAKCHKTPFSVVTDTSFSNFYKTKWHKQTSTSFYLCWYILNIKGFIILHHCFGGHCRYFAIDLSYTCCPLVWIHQKIHIFLPIFLTVIFVAPMWLFLHTLKEFLQLCFDGEYFECVGDATTFFFFLNFRYAQ